MASCRLHIQTTQSRPNPTITAGTGETPTLGTLDFYMARLHGAIERDPAQHERLIVRIKEILAQVASEHL
ncbi:Hypothetical predicted protein [Marmota monax]|uniref:Uncharacterized protein n=1 Tax=Marmota monax TaxID=9995 RepID=A0A5E4BWU1_MARMO|nr:hypothetical protein GHT09_018150 [Marmota monax]VTJ73451.1 Hypothetical predicted protein [Marmota monax]